jgi:hypothetical protein
VDVAAVSTGDVVVSAACLLNIIVSLVSSSALFQGQTDILKFMNAHLTNDMACLDTAMLAKQHGDAHAFAAEHAQEKPS